MRRVVAVPSPSAEPAVPEPDLHGRSSSRSSSLPRVSRSRSGGRSRTGPRRWRDSRRAGWRSPRAPCCCCAARSSSSRSTTSIRSRPPRPARRRMPTRSATCGRASRRRRRPRRAGSPRTRRRRDASRPRHRRRWRRPRSASSALNELVARSAIIAPATRGTPLRPRSPMLTGESLGISSRCWPRRCADRVRTRSRSRRRTIRRRSSSQPGSRQRSKRGAGSFMASTRPQLERPVSGLQVLAPVPLPAHFATLLGALGRAGLPAEGDGPAAGRPARSARGIRAAKIVRARLRVQTPS